MQAEVVAIAALEDTLAADDAAAAEAVEALRLRALLASKSLANPSTIKMANGSTTRSPAKTTGRLCSSPSKSRATARSQSPSNKYSQTQAVTDKSK